MNVNYGWEETLNQYQVDTVLLPVDAALAGALKESRGWRVVYQDTRAIVFRGTTPAADVTADTRVHTNSFSTLQTGWKRKPIGGPPAEPRYALIGQSTEERRR